MKSSVPNDAHFEPDFVPGALYAAELDTTPYPVICLFMELIDQSW
jgi:hypothetical protein